MNEPLLWHGPKSVQSPSKHKQDKFNKTWSSQDRRIGHLKWGAGRGEEGRKTLSNDAPERRPRREPTQNIQTPHRKVPGKYNNVAKKKNKTYSLDIL